MNVQVLKLKLEIQSSKAQWRKDHAIPADLRKLPRCW